MIHRPFETFIDELQARVEIEDALKRFIRGVDRQDWSLARSTYHDDAIDEHGFFTGDADAFIAVLKHLHADQDHSVHMLSNILIEFSTADLALVETYCLVMQRFGLTSKETPAGSAGVRKLGTSRYVDIFERRCGEWKVAHRTLILGDMEATAFAEPPQFPEGFVLQRHDVGDRLYDIRTKLLERSAA